MKFCSSWRTIAPLGFQRIRPWPTCVVDGEQAQLRAEHAVVALLGFVELLQVLVELLLVEERGAVDALEAVGVDVAVPVGLATHMTLNALDLAGARGRAGPCRGLPSSCRACR